MRPQNYPSHSRPLNSPSSSVRPHPANAYPSYSPQSNHHQQQTSYPASASASTPFPVPSQYAVGQHYQNSYSQQHHQQSYRPSSQSPRPPPPPTGHPHPYPEHGRRPQQHSASMTMPTPAHWSPSPPLQHSSASPAVSMRPPTQTGGNGSYPPGQGGGQHHYASGPIRMPSGGGPPPPIPNRPHSGPTSPVNLVSPPPLPAKDPLVDDEADFQAALLASQLSAQEEAAFRRCLEEEELRKLQQLHHEEQAERQRRDQERRREEEEQMRLVMAQSREEEERRDQEARDREARALEESRVQAAREALRRMEEEEEEMRKVMEASLREEWERRREAEEEELETVERIRREIEDQRALAEAGPAGTSAAGPSVTSGYGGSKSKESDAAPAAPPDSNRSRRPLPSLPPVRPATQQATSSLQMSSPAMMAQSTPAPQRMMSSGEDPLDDDDRDDPFADSAEAPPAYDNVGADRPPEAPSRAPTGFWDAARATRIREQRAAAAASGGGRGDETQLVVHAPTDPLEEKKRMEAAGRRHQDSVEGSTGDSSHTGRCSPSPGKASSARQAQHEPVLASMPEGSQEEIQFPSRPKATPVQHGSGSIGSAVNALSSGSDVPSMGRQDSHSSLKSTTSRLTTNSTRSNSMTSTAPTRQTTAVDSLSDHDKTARLSREATSPPTVTESSVARPSTSGQKAPLGIDWGYSQTAFARKLSPGSGLADRNGSLTSGQSCDQAISRDEQEGQLKMHFPNMITLGAVRDISGKVDSESQSHPFFTIRCGSWKILLRSLAWLGNTRIEAGPQEIADAAEHNGTPLLRVEVEFVTPAIRKGAAGVTGTFALQQYPGGAKGDDLVARARQEMSNRPTACVSVCISLCQRDLKGQVHRQQRSGSTGPSQAYIDGARRQAERELDLEYMKRGSDRRVLNLPPSSMGLGPVVSSYSLTYQVNPNQVAKDTRLGLDLPTTLIQLAEHLQKAHRYSAACSSSGYTARHSPRDLYHTIEAHDDKYIGKLQKDTIAQQGQGASSGLRGSAGSGLIYTPLQITSSPLPLPSNPSSSNPASDRETRLLPLSSVGVDAPSLLLWDESSLGHPSSIGNSTTSNQNPLLTSLSYNSLGANGPNGTEEGGEGERSGLGRMKDRVKKKLKGRQGDVGDGEELANWITPLDLSDVGGGEDARRGMSRDGSSSGLG